MRFEGSPFAWAAVAVVLLLVIPNLYHSGTGGSVRGGRAGTEVTCDGNTGIDMHSNECLVWGAAMLSGEIEWDVPPGANDGHGYLVEDVSRIEIERALFGFLDRCTAKVYTDRSSPAFEQVIPCR